MIRKFEERFGGHPHGVGLKCKGTLGSLLTKSPSICRQLLRVS